MRILRHSGAWTGIATFLLGATFCILLFSYGVTQEVPIGQVEGIVTLAETGMPLPGAEVGLSVKDDENARDRYVTADSKGHFRFRNLKVGEYDISVSAQEHHAKEHAVTVVEGRTLHLDLKLAPNAPYLKLYASQRVWAPGDAPQLEIHGFRAGDAVDVEVDRVAFDKLLGDGHFTQAVNTLRGQEGFNVPASFEKYSTKKAAFRHKVKNRDSEGAFVEALNIPILPEGFYWVKCQGKASKAATYINVTHIALVTKTAKGHALGYVTDLVNGSPIKDAKVWSRAPDTNTRTSVSGSDGLVETTYGALPDSQDSRASLIAMSGSSMALVGVYTSEDEESSGDAKIVLYTDRPIYRPGDDVQFKGIIRRRTGLGYLTPSSGTVEMQINDTDDQPIAKFPLPVSAHGAFSGHFTTSKEAGPGLYRIVAKASGSRGSHFVNMMAYRKPEMAMQIKSVKPFYYIGNKAQASIQCSYYFGGPVVGAKLHINVFASPGLDVDPDDEDDSRYHGDYQGGDLSKTIDAVTDEKGQAVIQFDTRQPNDSSTPLTDLDFSIDVNATDASNKFVSSTGSVHVVRGDFGVTAASQTYLASPGQTIDLLVRTRSNQSGHAPVGGRSITVKSSIEEWKDNKETYAPVGEYRAVTASDGVVHVPVRASRPGSMLMKVYSRDDSNRLIIGEDSVYVIGGRYHSEADQSKFEVVLDKRRYKLGETARVMLRSLVFGGSALVTVQTDRVLWRRVVPLQDMATFIDIPVTANFLPNCFVSVAYVHKKKFYEGDARLAVEPGDQRLSISVESDKATFLPGEQAHLTVHTKNAAGMPVPAEVSLGVVDESIYAIREDDFDIFEQFYPKKTNSVTTSYSFSEVYLDGGDKGGANLTIRRKFLDTAAWIPSVQTDSMGVARLSVQLPDNLTEWRATAVGITDQSAVGRATAKFKARKSLMVRLEMPEFLVQQDDRQMAVIITNETGRDQDVQFSLAGAGISISGGVRQRVHIDADRPASLIFSLRTGDPGFAHLTAKVWIVGGPSDGVEQSFPVLAHGIPIRKAWSDEITDSRDYSINLDPTVDRTTGRLKVTLSGSLAGKLVSSLDGLIGFPYGCVEQTMSRFMPSILVAKTVRDLGMPQSKLESQIPKIAADAMIRLARMQHEDGGWGWWENDASDPFMTALVLDGLDRCTTAGFAVRKVNIDKAVSWCVARTQSKDWATDSLRSKCYMVYALSKYGKGHEARLAYPTLRLRDTTPADRATLILAANELGASFRLERDRLLDRLSQQAHQGPLGAYWERSDWDWGSESTALALTAYMTVRPSDPIVPRIVRYLMEHRKGDMWDSTRDTSYSLIGLTLYLSRTHEQAGNFQANILIEGKLLKSVHLDSSKVDEEASTVEVPIASIHAGSNTFRIEKVGTGTCYASLDLQETEIRAKMVPSEPTPGLRVVRKYYRMEARRLEDGTMRLLPSKKPVMQAESGDTIRVELTVTSNKSRQFMMVEDPTPSNCRVTDREQLDEGEEWSFWWDRLVIHDEKVAFFIHNLHEGTQTLTYTMRAEGLGTAHALPTSISNMYDLAERASGAESILEVK